MAGTKDTTKTSKAAHPSNAATAKKHTSGDLTDDDEMPTVKAKCSNCSFLKATDYPRPHSLPCIIKVDTLPPMGLTNEGPEPIQMFLDIRPGPYNMGPEISLEFMDNDLDPDTPCAVIDWGIDDYMGGRWLTTNLVIQSVSRCSSNKGINDPAVVDRFRESNGRMPEGIMCMTIDVSHSRSKVLFDEDLDDYKVTDRETMMTLFQQCKPYKIRIWFAVPFDFPQMEAKCLKKLRAMLLGRVAPLDGLEEWDLNLSGCRSSAQRLV